MPTRWWWPWPPPNSALLADIAPRSAAARRPGADRLDTRCWPWRCRQELRSRRSPGCWWPPGEDLHCKAVTLSTRKWGRCQSGGRGEAELLRLSFGRFGDTLARDVSDTIDLLAWALEDLDTVFGIRAEPVGMLVHRWIDAAQYDPGHGELAAELRAGLPRTPWRSPATTSTASGFGLRDRCGGCGHPRGTIEPWRN